MPEVIRSLWFEEISFIHEKFFDTPIGKLTVRQVAIVFVFGISAWAAFNSVGDDVLKVAITSLLVILGLAFAFQRIKTLTPEQSMMFALFAPRTGRGGTGRPKKNTKTSISTLPVNAGQQQEGSETFDISMRDAGDDVHDTQMQKLVVLVRDPQTGTPLPNRGCEILVEGKSIGRRLTDEEGFLTIPLVPKPGINTIEVKPEGYSTIVKSVTVDIQMRQAERLHSAAKTAQGARN